MNSQEYITIKLIECLDKILPLSKNIIINMCAFIIGMISSKSTNVANIVDELEEWYSKGKNTSIIKRLQRFLYTKIAVEAIYEFFAREIIKNYKDNNRSKTVRIVIDHTSKEDHFIILQFSLIVGKRTIPIWFRIFKYEKGTDAYLIENILDGIKDIYRLLKPYGYKAIILADRWFMNTEICGTIMAYGYDFAIRAKGNTNIIIPGNSRIEKLSDIKVKPRQRKYFKKVKLTNDKFVCNLAVTVDKENGDVWYIVTNMEPQKAVEEYKKRFRIEEMFKDLKSNGLNIEEAMTFNLQYFSNIYLCACIGYTWMVSNGCMCTKKGLNDEIGAVKHTKKHGTVRVYSLFKAGVKWLKRCLRFSEYKQLRYNFAVNDS